jgi:hypothetical protein
MSLYYIYRILSIIAISALAILLCSDLSISSDWNQWLGPNRDNTISENSGWNNKWALKELWRINVGYGVSSPIIVKNRVYVMGWKNDNDHVYCLDTDGKNGKPNVLWTKSYPCPAYLRGGTGANGGYYKGVLATPVMDVNTGFLYTLSCDGGLCCWEAYNKKDPGKLRWKINLFSDYSMTVAEEGDYGFLASPLLYGDWLIAAIGHNTEGSIWAFDKNDGSVRWKSKHCADRANASPALVVIEGVPCVAAIVRDAFIVVRMDNGYEGETVVECPWKSYCNESNPSLVVSGDKVLATMCDSAGKRTNLITINSLNKNDYTIKDFTDQFFTCTSTAALYKDDLYFRSGKKVRSFTFDSGEMNWESDDIFSENHPMGAEVGNLLVTANDSKMIIWDGMKEGNLVLAEASPDSGWKELARVNDILKKREYEQGYPHVAISNGKIVCKNIEGDVVCLYVGKRNGNR